MPGGCHRRGDRAGGHDVIFFDEYAVEQTHAVIAAAADPHRIFLCRTQAGYGLAGVQQAAIRAFEQHRIGMRGRGGAGEQLQEIERRALAREQGAGRTLEGEQEPIGGDRVAFGDAPLEPDPCIDGAEAGIDIGYAADDGRLPRDHGSPANPIRRNQGGRQITAADVLGQGVGDLLRQVGGYPKRFRTGGRARVRSCT